MVVNLISGNSPNNLISNKLICAFTFLILLPADSHAIDSKLAQKTFKKCRSCHEIGEAAKSKVGPNLNGLSGRPIASVANYKYSKGFHKAAETKLVWNQKSLNKFLTKPRAMIKGTKMGFSGIKKDAERENLIAWLLHFDANGNELSNLVSIDKKQTKLLGNASALLEGDLEYGEYLSGECVTCHKVDGSAQGIPSIIKWPKENFIDALYQYKTKLRKNAVMQNVTKRLGDEEMAALAAYFGSLPTK